MKFLSIIFFILYFFPLAAKNPRATHIPKDTTQQVQQPKPDSGFVSIHDFFTDTLRNDSFFKINYATYLLPKKQLTPDDENYINSVTVKPAYRRDLVFYFVIFVVLLLLFIKFNFSKLYHNAIASFYSRAATAEIINDKYSPRWLFILFSNLFFVLVITLWIYRNFIPLEPPYYEERFDIFTLIFVILVVVYLVKYVIHLLLGSLFKATDAIIIYLLNISITNLVCAMVMLMVTLLLFYSPWHGQPWLLNTSYGVLLLFIVLRYFRGFSQTIQYFKFNYLYLILYLCAIEIAPWFLIIKYLNKYL